MSQDLIAFIVTTVIVTILVIHRARRPQPTKKP